MPRVASVRVSYANVMSTIAVFIALGGTSYAAVTLKKGSVTSREVKDQSLQSEDLAPGVIGSGPAGARGPRGADGPTGPPGERGPSDVIIRRFEDAKNFASTAGASVEAARFTVPAGKWYVTASVNIVNPLNSSIFRCQLVFDGKPYGTNQSTDVGNGGALVGWTTDMTLIGATQSAAPQVITLTCWHDGALDASTDSSRVERIRVSALRVANIDDQPL